MKNISQEQINEAAVRHSLVTNGREDTDSYRHAGTQVDFEAGAQWAISKIQDQWVAVSDRLPEPEGVVLGWRPLSGLDGEIGHRPLIFYINGEWCTGLKKISGITHWQPLPEPPRKEVSGE